MRIKKFIIPALLIFTAGITFPQSTSVDVFSSYSVALDKRLGVTSADALGGGVKVKLPLAHGLSFFISGGYELFSISQENGLEKWGWFFWDDRYSSKIEADLSADPNLAVEIVTIQKMDLIPIMIGFNYEIEILKDLSILPSAGAGILFFTRRLFIEENWSKTFNQINYVFQYSYRNFAPKKYGNPAVLNGGIDLKYGVLENLVLLGGLHYLHVLDTEGRLGYENFPFGSGLDMKLGLTFIY